MPSLLDDRPSLWIKAGLAVGLIVLGDILLFRDAAEGASVGLMQLAFVAAALVHPDLRHSRLGLLALAAATLFGLVLIEHFSPLAWLLSWTALGVAVLAAGADANDGAWQWAQRLAVLGAKSAVGPLLDLRELGQAKDVRKLAGLRALPLTVAMPLIGAAIFVWLFAVANPLIGDWFAAWRLPEPDLGRLVFWGFLGLLAWGVLRPRQLGKTWATADARSDLALPGATPASVTLSLIVFNAIFALQNALDIAFLWSGAALPDGMTFAGYAHRGAYPLIVTALLAGLFVLVFLRPGSETARRPLVRWLVSLWILQNLFLVASTAMRTVDYIEGYSLTELRIAALVWMGLVAAGLALIGWRLIRGKSAAWLINANALALGLVLAACSLVDFSAVAAGWNVRHAREVGGQGAPLDWDYLADLREAAFIPLIELERRTSDPGLRASAITKRCALTPVMVARQAEWRSWSWRRARRLARASGAADCAGYRPIPRPAPLTPPAKP